MSQVERWSTRGSLITNRIRAVHDGDWRGHGPLPLLLRAYSATPPVVACAVIAVLALHADWHLLDFEKFLVFACCGVISVASTPRVAYTSGGVTRDFGSTGAANRHLAAPRYVAVVSIPLWRHCGILGASRSSLSKSLYRGVN